MESRASAAWRVVFRVSYRLIRLADPLVRSAIALGLPLLDGVVRVSVPGRVTARTRRMLLTLLHVDGAWYVGHPNGPTAWTRNAEAAGWLDVDPPGADGPRFAVRRLGPGPERDAVIRATWSQQPFPANLLYRAAARHVAAVGVYFRLAPVAVEPHLPADSRAAARPADPLNDSRPASASQVDANNDRNWSRSRTRRPLVSQRADHPRLARRRRARSSVAAAAPPEPRRTPGRAPRRTRPRPPIPPMTHFPQ